MKKLILLFLLCAFTTAVFAEDNSAKEDNSFKIVGVVTLLCALLLAVRSLKNTYRK